MGARWRPTPWQLVPGLVGLWVFGTGEALIVAAKLGNSPWTVLAQGVSKQTPLWIGAATFAISVVVLLCWIPRGEWPGLGAVVNAVVIGVAVDVTLELLPSLHSHGARWTGLF